MADNNNRSEYFEDRAGTDEARYHAVPHDKGWAVKKEGQDEPESTHNSQNEAADEAKRLAKDAGTIAYIHDEDGQIETQEDYKG